MNSVSSSVRVTSTVSAPLKGMGAPAVQPTYSQILKSTAVIGAASAVNVAFGIARTKAMALFLGPAGVGLLGLYSSIAELAQSLAGIGIQSSGVRQIAEAVGSGDPERISRTAAVVKRVSVVLGLFGALLLVVFSRPVSRFTFGSDVHSGGVAMLSVAVLFGLIAAGRTALIQGMRRIPDLARLSVLSALLGTLISIPIVYLFRQDGIVPSLVVVAGVSILTAWWYGRKVQIETHPLTIADLISEAAALLKLGAAFMSSAFLTMGAAYIIRIIVLRTAGFSAAGLYQAAWTLGGLYVGFILQSMGADFYPRLTAVSKNDAECNRLVNEQAQISLLLAGPGVIATLTLAPLVIAMFFSTEFREAVGLLRWICLGMILRVVAWPMGFIVLAKGERQIFFWTEVAATLVHVGLAWWFVTQFGLYGAGAAFFGLYVWHSCLIYAVVRRLSGFTWSTANRRLVMSFLPVTGLIFASFYLVPLWLATTAGVLAVILTGVHSMRTLLTLIPHDSIPEMFRSLLLRVAPAGTEVKNAAS